MVGQYWVWIAVLVLAVGFVAGRLSLQLPSMDSCNKLNPANATDFFKDCYAQYTDEQLRHEREKKQQDFDKIKKNFEAAKISSKEYEEAAAKLQQELQLLDLKFTSEIQKKMLKCLKKIDKKRN